MTERPDRGDIELFYFRAEHLLIEEEESLRSEHEHPLVTVVHALRQLDYAFFHTDTPRECGSFAGAEESAHLSESIERDGDSQIVDCDARQGLDDFR
ncbi:hypothetical protein [Skermania piniformis]|uniref:hypothetical protein n=1 Tax=Skermania pinensis TaxID=39122 RepID=UPI001FEB6456|nr:hypothetical protein [Skermania piniformis]